MIDKKKGFQELKIILEKIYFNNSKLKELEKEKNKILIKYDIKETKHELNLIKS
jgi:hypothetical protein